MNGSLSHCWENCPLAWLNIHLLLEIACFRSQFQVQFSHFQRIAQSKGHLYQMSAIYCLFIGRKGSFRSKSFNLHHPFMFDIYQTNEQFIFGKDLDFLCDRNIIARSLLFEVHFLTIYFSNPIFLSPHLKFFSKSLKGKDHLVV